MWLVIAVITGLVLIAAGVLIAVLKKQWLYILYMAVPVLLAVGLIVLGELTNRESYPASIPFMAGMWVILIALFARNKKSD